MDGKDEATVKHSKAGSGPVSCGPGLPWAEIPSKYAGLCGQKENRNKEQWKAEKAKEENGQGKKKPAVKLLRFKGSLFVGWLLNVRAIYECISETNLLRQFYVLPH